MSSLKLADGRLLEVFRCKPPTLAMWKVPENLLALESVR